ncbi:MAG: efflux RND transporter permease subunit [Tannerella sp.]|nr:efflux RND transporter permease subunit [Tannerella sp.]
MRKLINFALKSPVTISMIVLAILLLGYISYNRLNVDLLPNINSPRLFIEVEIGERPPEEIEKMFIENMESTAMLQRDVIEVASVIKAGTARITVEYTQQKNMDEAFIDLQKAMSTFSTMEEITSLNITQHDPNTAPVMLIAMSHQNITDMAELRKMAESYIRNELIRLEGVAEVALSGDEKTILTVKTDAHKLKEYGLTMDEIATRIEANNQSISGGRVSELGIRYLVKTTTQLNTLADFENLIVAYKSTSAATGTTTTTATPRGDNQAPLYLREVASVSFENDRPENIVRLNGKRCIGLSVYKEMQQNTVRVVDELNQQLSKIQQALPGYDFQVITNQGTFITNAVGEVKTSALLGMVLAIAVLFVFLRRVGTTLIVSLSIPISIVATFNLMYFNGLTINIMSLSGLALGGGMLIDNAIVVIESIFRHQERGENRVDSIVTGTSEVSGAVIASTISTIVVFLPIIYLHGASGVLFKDQAWTVAFSLLSSLFVSLLVIPMLYDKLSGRKNVKTLTQAIHFKWYSRLLESFLHHRRIVIILSVALLLVTALLLPFVGTEFLPRSESQTFTISVKLPEGTRLERTDAVVQQLDYLIETISGDSLCTVYSHAGKGTTEEQVFEGEHTATMKVTLSKASKLPPNTVIERFIESTNMIEGLELTFKQEENSLASLLGSDDAPIVVEVKGEDIDEITSISDEIIERMNQVAGIYNIKSSMEDGAPELIINIDRTMAGINNLSASTVIQQVSEQLEGRSVGRMDYRGEMRDIVIKIPDVTAKDLQNLIIQNGNQEFRLNEISTVVNQRAPKEIFRRNQTRINRILADKEINRSLDKVSQQIRQATADIDLPLNYSISVTGEEEKRQESMNSLLMALVLSIVLVYMVLASQFESLLHPFTILLTIPLGLVGAILIFLVFGLTINIMGVIGIIVLAGIAINNSIILVVRINQLKENMSLEEAIIQAGQQRIRPIIMTSLTTILVLLPMSLNIGEGAALRSSLAIAVIGGLVTSTLMSLVVIPCVYYVFERMKLRFGGGEKYVENE